VEELVMHARFILIAAATAMTATAHAAEPAKPAPQPAAQNQPRPAELLLASADHVQAPATADQQAAPKPHRVARVTTCRCGDQQAQPDQQ
jgi:hypothetical protein